MVQITVATCRKCRNEIVEVAPGRWGTEARMIRGCYHIPVRDSVRPVTPPDSRQAATA